MSNALQNLLADVQADGKVDAGEVVALRTQIFEDGVVDRAEADAMFALNDSVTGADNDPTYTSLMVDVIANHVLNDSESPGVVDEDEANWLIEKVEADGQVDGVELAIARSIAAQAKSVPAFLTDKFREWGV
jgi:hypothetical protein